MSDRLFAIGDIHGCFEALQNLIENKIMLTKKDKLVLLGDYIDRGSQIKEVIDYIISLIENGYDIITLMGNHESVLLKALEKEEYIPGWIQNGGNKTIESFGLHSLNELDKKYVLFFKELHYYYSINNFLFVHAGFNDKIENPFTDFHKMLWSRNHVHDHPKLNDKIIIHGHTPVTLEYCQKLVAERKHTINIDTGCVYAGYPDLGHLTALELHKYKLYSV